MWIQNLYEKYDTGKMLFIVAFTIIMMTPYNISYCHGNKDLYRFVNKIIHSQKYKNSVIAVPDFMIEYEIAPLIVPNNQNIDLYAVKDYYNYDMYEYITDNPIGEIKKFAENQEKRVYILTHMKVDDLKLIDNYQNIRFYLID